MIEKIGARPNTKCLSTDLTGFENHMLIRGHDPYHMSLLKCAPKLLFELFGSVASLDFLSIEDFIANYEKLLEDRYMPGTRRRYTDGI